MNEMVGQSSKGVLTYGSVELCLFPYYMPGDTICVSDRLQLAIVNRVEKADGIVVLGQVPNEKQDLRPTTMCVLFTHYYRNLYADVVDHFRTVATLSIPSERIRIATERAFIRDLLKRSIAASFACKPSVRYL